MDTEKSEIVAKIKTFLQYAAFTFLTGYILANFTTFVILERIVTFPFFRFEYLFLNGIIIGYLTAYYVTDLQKSFFITVGIILVSFFLTIIFYATPSLLGINPALETVLFSAVGWSMIYSLLLMLSMFFGLVIGFILHSVK
ncbi:MAG: hypothetical protein PVF58_10865 [Candidatus Methanofastidiosia archaeon]|jgi:hypothetical protein